MPLDYAELLGRIDDAKVTEIYGSCSRKIRNMLEGMYGKKAKKGRKVSLKSLKDKDGAALAVRDGLVAAGEHQTAEELLKTWLLTRRELLKDALDYFQIPHEDGITDAELDVIEKAEAEALTALVNHLTEKGHALQEVSIYLAFLKVQNFENVPNLPGSLSAS